MFSCTSCMFSCTSCTQLQIPTLLSAHNLTNRPSRHRSHESPTRKLITRRMVLGWNIHTCHCMGLDITLRERQPEFFCQCIERYDNLMYHDYMIGNDNIPICWLIQVARQSALNMSTNAPSD